MLIVLALIATLSAVLYPAVMNKLTEARAAAITQTLDGINQAVQNYRGNVGRFPRTLSQLSTKPATAALELCQGTTPDVNIDQWRGPYASRTFVAAGTQVGDGTVQDVLRRVPANNASTAFGVAYVDVTSVDSAVAVLIESSFDGGNPLSYTAGTVQWTRAAALPAGPVGTLSFGIPVRGC
jgi:type II secretory pathway pseudopilin PulG